MMQRLTISAARAKGFTLLELLLSIGLLALLLAGMYQLFDSWMQRAINRYAASDMMRVQNASEDYVLANFEVFKGAALNTFVEININDLKTFNYLPTGYQPRNSFKQLIRTFRRTVRVNKLTKAGANALDSNGNPIYIYTIEVLTASDNPASGVVRIPNKRLLDTAQAGGPTMGVIGNIVMGGTTFVGRATSLYSEWFVDLVGLNAAGYTATPDAVAGGYLAAYGLVNAEGIEANDAWLYRVDVDTRPELNRMETNLLMNGNQLQSVGTLIADKINVTGNSVFRGVAQGLASDTAQALTVDQAVRVNSATESRINMKDTSGGCTMNAADVNGNRSVSGAGCTMAGGEVQVISAANNATMRLGGLTADGAAITDITNVTNTTDSRGINTFSTYDGTNLGATNQLISPIVSVTGASINTQQLQSGNLAVGANSEVKGSLVSARIQPGGAFGVTTRQLDVGNQATFNSEIRANAITGTVNVYIDNMLPACVNTPSCYTDAQMGGRVIQCRSFGVRTYCEPRGVYNWAAQNVSENCFDGPGADRYSCSYTQIAPANPLGTCQFVRSVGASGQAYHQVTNCI